MSLDFINPLMLIGLAGISLPILAHLLSKRKYDVVEWGAMQFLELGRNTRRKLQLEELLLLLLRIGLIGLIVTALSRPWAAGGFLANLVSTGSRDVVFVIDGSYSMGWEGKAVTPHAAAVQRVHDFLEEMHAGDSAAVLDARDRVRPIIESPTQDFDLVRESLADLPPPAGSSNLAAAVARAVNILSRTSNLSRDVVVLTDGQARGWSAGDANLWTRFDDLLKQPRVRPRVWVMDVGDRQAGESTNFSVEKLGLSRELTVPGFPVRIKTKVQYSGGQTPISRRVYLEVDGQRLGEKTLSVNLHPDGEATVEFEHRFTTAGSHLVSVVLDEDNLPGDNRAAAALSVSEALPVLLVDGDPNVEAIRSETFFAKSAFSASLNETPWVRATVVPWDQFGPDDLQQPEVVVLANVPRLNESQTAALRDFVARGGGLLIALGDEVDADGYNRRLAESGRGLMPASLVSVEKDTAEELQGVKVVDSSLDLPWMTRFRSENDGGFAEARFSQWWKVEPAAEVEAGEPGDGPLPDGPPSPASDALKMTAPKVTAPLIAARLSTSDPLLVTRNYGRGGVVLMTSAIDADWSTLPAKHDYVALLHEIVFHLASGKNARNVDVGMPLLLPAPVDSPIDGYAFFGPGETEFPPIPAGDELRPLVRLDDTRLPGVYRFGPKQTEPRLHVGNGTEYFVVDFDRGESDLAPLDDTERALLSKDDRLAFVGSLDELKRKMFEDDSRSEFWYLLLLLFLAFLVGEVVMTRRLVQGGHAVVEEATHEMDGIQ